LIAESDVSFLRRAVGQSLFPIGTASGHTIHILMAEDGSTLLLDMDQTVLALLSRDADGALEALCDGRNGRVDSHEVFDGELTGRVLRPGTERECWGIECYPGVAPFLPAESWEPARRPPTVLAMVKTLNASAAGLASPSADLRHILVGPGGLVHLDDDMYFVTHTENAMWVRRTTGVRVAPPPPGFYGMSRRPGVMEKWVPPKSIPWS
jgi:hypothetical protein